MSIKKFLTPKVQFDLKLEPAVSYPFYFVTKILNQALPCITTSGTNEAVIDLMLVANDILYKICNIDNFKNTNRG